MLVPLLQSSTLPVREQRELLAGLYLRRGFLASAAEEWMAVCNEQRTHVRWSVWRRSPPLTASGGRREFASEALTLEPANPVASRLLAAVAA